MRRPPKGATTRPTLSRPGSGYGRPLSRPEPSLTARLDACRYRGWWHATSDLVDAVGVAEPTPAGGAPPGLLDHQR
jgi:hypothetical protein